MPQVRARTGIYLTILVLGAYSQIVQALLIRESLVVFYGNEVSLGAFYGSWLLWIALGSAAVTRWRRRRWVSAALPTLRRLLLSLPLLLFLQILSLRGVRWLLDTSSTEFVPLGELFLSVSLITLPSSLAIGVAFPLACKRLRDLTAEVSTVGTVRNVSNLYVVEALGALLGGVLFTFVLIQWFGVWRTLGALSAVLAAVAWVLSARTQPLTRTAVLVLGAAGLALAATPLASLVGQRMEALRFATLQPGLQLLDAVETRYGHVAVARLGPQTSVVTDGHIAESFPLPAEVRRKAAYLYAQSNGARRVLTFDGFAGGLPTELLRYPLASVDLVEPDRRAFEEVRPYLPAATRASLDSPRLRVHFQDGRRYVSHLSPGAGFDLVLVLNAAPTSAYSNRYFTLDFYRQVAAAMAPDGVFCTRVSSASNYLGRDVRSYTGSVYRTLREVFPQVAIMPGDVTTFCGSRKKGQVTEDPTLLEDRYRAVPLAGKRFPPEGFYSLLPGERIAYVREQLESEDSELNTDAMPVTYYLNMLIWGKFSASGFVAWLDQLRRLGRWPYLVSLAVFVLLWMLRVSLAGGPRVRRQRQAASLALVVLGLIAMAAQLTLLFSYQAHVGFMFGRIALLNGLFMTGLALGAGGIGQYLARSPRAGLFLALLLGLVSLAMAALPLLLELVARAGGSHQEAAYLGLCVLAGLLTGIGFPLGVEAAHQDTGEVVATSGIVEAADHMGGAVGGLLTGALLVPLLGVRGTAHLLGLVALCALLPVLFARYAPVAMPALRRRGGHAFPFPLPLLGWGLLFLVLTQFGWSLLQQAAQPGPQLAFDANRLSAVSGSEFFQHERQPFPHYLGRATADLQTPAQTAALSTMAVAADVRGYAGPINLLLAVDREGILRGVSYVDSRETPSYIAEIEGWLAGLAGQDLSVAGLDLRRVDALSGATVTSQAALAAIDRTAAAVGQVVFDRSFAGAAGQARPGPAWLSPKFLATLGLLLLFFPVYLSGSEPARLVYQLGSLLVLGLWLNSLVTEIDLVNLSQGHWPSLAENPQRWLLLGFVLVTGLLFGQVWCGYVCPFGALQELVSRLGRFLYLRAYPQRPLETRLRFLKFLLLAAMLLAVWWSGDGSWAAFNPMQHTFGLHWQGWVGAVVVVSLVGALFYYRFWCRYFCPFGAFLALTNKLAFLNRWAPRRRFDHCDLGVKEEYDIDCIHCSRCLTGKDYGLRSKPARRHGGPAGHTRKPDL